VLDVLSNSIQRCPIDLEETSYLLLESTLVQIRYALRQSIAFRTIGLSNLRLLELGYRLPDSVAEFFEYLFGKERHSRVCRVNQVFQSHHELHEAN